MGFYFGEELPRSDRPNIDTGSSVLAATLVAANLALQEYVDSHWSDSSEPLLRLCEILGVEVPQNPGDKESLSKDAFLLIPQEAETVHYESLEQGLAARKGNQ